MKRFSFFALILALSLSLPMHDAEARRLGGGLSSGMKRDSGITQRQATPAPTPATPAQNMGQSARSTPAAAPATPQPSGMRRWLGPLAGIAAGLGLAALFSHLGMGAEMGSFIMMLLAGLAIFAVVRLLMRRSAAQMQPQPAGAPGYPPGPRVEPAVAAPQTTTAASTMNTAAHIPADFDAAAFLRQAKLNFIRLQAANDSGNMEDIRAFTAPEMYAEIQMQYQERGKAQQQTDVMQLEATLLDVTNEAQQQIASVRFFGLIRETADAAAENFSEVWHLTRPQDGSQGWMIAGIEQIN